MHAIRKLLTVQNLTPTITLPDHFRAKRVEVIVLDADESAATVPAAAPIRRQPSAALAGTRIVGDIVSPVIEPSDWDALK